MAHNILANHKGNTYHLKGSSLTPRTSSYRLAEADYFSIRSQAPSWETGPAASPIAGAEIERQRQVFIQSNGADGLYSIIPTKEIV